MVGKDKVATGDGAGSPAKAALPWNLATGSLAAGILVLVAFASAVAYASGWSEGVKTFVLLFVVSGAALWIGALVGFLFGIPKSRTDESSRLVEARPVEGKDEGGTPRETYWGNANLEEVSDWLTKIIVGIGLVEYTKLLNLFEEIGGSSEPIIGPYGKIVLPGSLLYFLVLGFMFCYLWTRVVFYRILVLVSVDDIRRTVKKEVDVLKKEFEESQIFNELYGALDVAKNTDRGKRDFGVLNPLGNQVRDIFNKDKLNRTAAILTARFVSEIQHDPMDPAGNERAIRHLDEFLNIKRERRQFDRDYADVLYNRACYSARFVAVSHLPPNNAEIIRRKRQAIDNLQESVNLAPDRAQLALTDPYFAGLLEDSDFKKVVAGAAPLQAN